MKHIEQQHPIMRRTRIVATIGPASCDEDSLRTMIKAGLDVARLNYSHGTDEWRAEVAQRIRKIGEECNIHVGILADLPGPKLRLGYFSGQPILEAGSQLTLRCGEATGEATSTTLPVEYLGLAEELQPGDPVLLSDGLIQLEVKSCQGNEVICEVIEGGSISQRKGINVPGTVVKLPAVGPRDEEALHHALSLGVEFIAVSYVRTVEDILPVRRILDETESEAWIISKIEHPMALESLDEIIEASDAVMVARGDLGVEIPPEEVPMAQERIVKSARSRGLPVIVATQMLESMVSNPRPTRAEVADVANAIRHGATGVMLSGETATGKYPVEALQIMLRITRRAAARRAGPRIPRRSSGEPPLPEPEEPRAKVGGIFRAGHRLDGRDRPRPHDGARRGRGDLAAPDREPAQLRTEPSLRAPLLRDRRPRGSTRGAARQLHRRSSTARPALLPGGPRNGPAAPGQGRRLRADRARARACGS